MSENCRKLRENIAREKADINRMSGPIPTMHTGLNV